MIASGYCERTGGATGTIQDFFGEPLNTLSNIAFLLAAALAWRRYRGTGRTDPLLAGLIATCFVIGIGSFAFHAYPTRITLLMDVLPIQIFILGYLALVLRRFLGLGVLAAAAGTAVFLAASFALVRMVGPGTLWGGIGYVPALAALLMLGTVLARRPEVRSVDAGYALLQAALIFAVSLAFRTLDRPLCEVWPIGLHPLWHLLNAVVLWRLLIAAIAHMSARGKP
jgi:hypothetical protein